jgi:hypothetical protein
MKFILFPLVKFGIYPSFREPEGQPFKTVGIGFNYIGMRYREDIQLPLMLGPAGKPKKRNLINYLTEVRILDQNGIPRNKIAEMMDVSRTSVYNLLEKAL